ncbi:MAG: guanylate kinase [Paludibacter sp.]|jgi:guanylate kinase|nr:guanylate kinase [Paludibacter sp.]
MSGKLIIFSAPSGSGKSTIISHLLKKFDNLEFSISATSRQPRGKEKNGVDYYFLSPAEFRKRIENQEFIEYEEVYTDLYYGTLVSEIDRISARGNVIIFDVDVKGGLNIKKRFGAQALSVFIAPPSLDVLCKRLIDRGTETSEMVQIRMSRAEYELSFVAEFDVKIVNDSLESAIAIAETVIRNFLAQ